MITTTRRTRTERIVVEMIEYLLVPSVVIRYFSDQILFQFVLDIQRMIRNECCSGLTPSTSNYNHPKRKRTETIVSY